MSLTHFFKKQFATVIEWTNQQPGILLYKFPAPTEEIKNSSKLIVAPGQGCLLVYEGKVADVLSEEGVYFLETGNHPFITTLQKLKQAGESEHKMHLFFYRKAESVNQPWGTASPVKYVDAVYGFPVELGMNGNYSFRIQKPQAFFTEIVGFKDVYSTADVRALLQSRIAQKIISYLAEARISYQQIDAQLSAISTVLKESLNAEFEMIGFELTDFRIGGTAFDAQTQKRINSIADVTAETMAAAQGGLNYVEMEKLKALRDAARNEGGLAGAGLQLGAGMEIGKLFAAQQDAVTANNANADPVVQLQKLKLLLTEGIITQEEFEAKKKDWLSKM